MFLKRAAVITLSSFILAACTSTSSPETQTQISNLESELVEMKDQVKQEKAALDGANKKVEEAKVEIEGLNKQLTDTQKQLDIATKELKQNSNGVVVEEQAKQSRYLDKTILGQAEWIYVSKAKKTFKARIDTGATTSSINALDIQQFERDGKKWVRFNITHSKDGKADIIEAPILRTAKIAQASKPGEESSRPVVKLHVRIGDVVQQAEFTLTNRQHMEYAVLIGRNFMKDVVLVDISQKYIHAKYNSAAKK